MNTKGVAFLGFSNPIFLHTVIIGKLQAGIVYWLIVEKLIAERLLTTAIASEALKHLSLKECMQFL